MKRKRLITIIIGFIAAVILGALLWPREREPESDGIPLSAWLKDYGNPRMAYPDSEDFRMALFKTTSAVRQIGTNALPFLLRWIQYEQPEWRKSVDGVVWKLPPALLRSRTARWLLADPCSDRANCAIAGFAFLGTNAMPALPELQRLAKNPAKPATQYRADMAVMVIPPHIDSIEFRMR